MMRMTLQQLPIGDKSVVSEIMTDHITKERLESLGLIQGVEIKTVRETPFGCPRVYRVLNTLISLRNKVAKQIIVEAGAHE